MHVEVVEQNASQYQLKRTSTYRGVDTFGPNDRGELMLFDGSHHVVAIFANGAWESVSRRHDSHCKCDRSCDCEASGE